MDIVSMDLGLGPDPRVLAVSEFTEAPSVGVVLVDLNGHEMLITMTVWMDVNGRVHEGGSHISGTGIDVWEGCVTVTGRAAEPRAVVRVDVTSERSNAGFSFEVRANELGWYAGCRPLPEEWESLEDISVVVSGLS